MYPILFIFGQCRTRIVPMHTQKIENLWQLFSASLNTVENLEISDWQNVQILLQANHVLDSIPWTTSWLTSLVRHLFSKIYLSDFFMKFNFCVSKQLIIVRKLSELEFVISFKDCWVGLLTIFKNLFETIWKVNL